MKKKKKYTKTTNYGVSPKREEPPWTMQHVLTPCAPRPIVKPRPKKESKKDGKKKKYN